MTLAEGASAARGARCKGLGQRITTSAGFIAGVFVCALIKGCNNTNAVGKLTNPARSHNLLVLALRDSNFRILLRYMLSRSFNSLSSSWHYVTQSMVSVLFVHNELLAHALTCWKCWIFCWELLWPINFAFSACRVRWFISIPGFTAIGQTTRKSQSNVANLPSIVCCFGSTGSYCAVARLALLWYFLAAFLPYSVVVLTSV